jgi:Predicted membrane protein (DUF2207) C-terminal domain/Predicted membrane protein (DUF2207) N-terminal domain
MAKLRPTGALVLALLLVALTASSVFGQSSTPAISWQRYDVDLSVQTDGSLAVTETQTISFRSTLQHGFRVVPLDRTTGITNVTVAEQVGATEQAYGAGSNRPGTYSTTRESDGLSIDWWFQPATNTTRTFVLRYVAHDAVRQYSAGDQVQWKAVYADRPGAVQAGNVSVDLPGDTTPDQTPSALYLFSAQGGPERDVGSATHVDARTVRFTLDTLPSGTGAEVRVQFPHGLVTADVPPWQAEADRTDWVQQTLAPIATFVALLFTLAILAGGGVALFLLWYSRGREPTIGATPTELDEPPSDLPAPLAGTLVDGSADLQDAVATLVDLGKRGVLTLLEDQGPEHDVRVALHRSTEDASLRRYERVLLTALFDRGAIDGEISLSAARPHFASAVPVLEERLHAAVVDEGLFVDNPELVRRRYTGIGIGLLVVGIALAIVAAVVLGWATPAVWLPGLAVALVGGGLIWLARAMPRRTPRGALEAARWQAFRAHLADENRRGAVDPQHLAYAVAFGIDRTFLRRVEQLGDPAPEWYGPGPVVIMPGGWYGGPWVGGSRRGGSPPDGSSPNGSGGSTMAPPAPNPQGWSDDLAGLLTAASEALAHGGGSGGWSGGGWGGGGGGGGGRGGFN